MAPGSDKAGAGDMFLSVKGAKRGAIGGEAHDDQHGGEIEVLGWSWGMQAQISMSGGTASGRAAVRELRITKRVDKSSTALMQALRENEVIKEAVLVLRKTGSKPLEYLKITLKNGRVASVDLEAGNDAGASTLIERVSFTFNKIEVEYTPQGQDGQAQGRVSFVDEWGEAS